MISVMIALVDELGIGSLDSDWNIFFKFAASSRHVFLGRFAWDWLVVCGDAGGIRMVADTWSGTSARLHDKGQGPHVCSLHLGD